MEATNGSPVLNNKESVLNFKDKILEVVKTFTTELGLSFEYIKNTKELESFYKKIASNEKVFSKFVSNTVELLKPYEICITNVVLTERKIKTSEYSFLANLKLFDGLLDLSLFSNENKNTKKMLTKYLYSLYFSCFLHELSNFESLNLEDHLQKFMSNLQNTEEENQVSNKPSESSTKRTGKSNQSNGLESVMESMFASPDLFNIASELTEDLKTQNVNPMSLIQGLMSGNMDGRVGDMIQNMTQKLESKIANGELDTKQLEEQTQKMMSQLPIGDLMKNLGSLGGLGGLGNLGNLGN